jgi:hypothetical protein
MDPVQAGRLAISWTEELWKTMYETEGYLKQEHYMYCTSLQSLTEKREASITFFLIPFYLQAVHVHLANGVKLIKA